MLLELDALARGLEDAGIEPPVVHNDIQRPGKRPTLRIMLDESGGIEAISRMSNEELMDCWTMGDGNKNQFPAIKLSMPTRPAAHAQWLGWKKENPRPDHNALLDIIGELRRQHEICLDGLASWPDSGYREKVLARSERLHTSDQDLLLPLELYKRFTLITNSGITLLEDLDQILWAKCQAEASEDLLKLAATVFFGEKLKANGQEDDGKKVTLLLDVSGVSFDRKPASHRYWVKNISAALFASESVAKKTGTCSITGDNADLLDSKLPKINLPVIGNTVLYSRFDGGGNKSVRRYGRAATDALAVSADRADAMAAALSYLASDSGKGKYWLPIECDGGSDVFFAWSSAAHDIDLVSPLAGRALYEVEDEDDYQKVSEKTLDMLRGKNVQLDAEANFIVLHKISDGVQKITWSSIRSLGSLMDASVSWQIASKNHPPITLAVGKGGDGNTLFWSPLTIAPLSLLSLTRTQYTASGKQKVKLPGLSTGLVMQLFWGSSEAQRNAAAFFLNRLYRQFRHLLERIAVGGRAYKLASGKQYDTKIDERKEALQCIGALGLTLHKLNREKEVYMEGAAYRLGQLCAAWDELHIGYCADVRSGQLPARLLGNKAYAMAVNNPAKALEIVSVRVGPYAAWATKTLAELKASKAESIEKTERKQFSSQAINGAYAYRWAGGVSKDLAGEIVGQGRALDSQYKAELLLGYMAGRPYEGKNLKDSEEEK